MNDLYDLDSAKAKEIEDSSKAKSAGVICPRNNKSIGGRCMVCEALQPLWRYPDGTEEKDVARRKKATLSYFMNVVMPSAKEKPIIMCMGRKIANYLIDSVKDPNMGFRKMAHPEEGQGFWLVIKKSKSDGAGRFPVYNAVKGDTCDWTVAQEVLDKRADLSQENLIKMLKNNELNSDNFYNISELKFDESIKVRVLPPWNLSDETKQDYRWFCMMVWRHWGGVTEAEVNGETPVDLTLPQTNGKNGDMPTTKAETPAKEEPVKEKSDEKPPCFGMPHFHDPEDDDCKECSYFDKCAVKIERDKLKNS